ncbi:MAG TPA: glycosyltransferase family 2 protein [Longimicrobium sp.]
MTQARSAPATQATPSVDGAGTRTGGAGSEPLVSIIVNNYNYERFLGHAIDSALAQTYPRVEVLVVDDGSTDGSHAVIAGYGERVKAVLKENGGQASAFNAGFAASRGQIVMFLDADDVLRADAVARVVSAWAPGTAKVQFRLQFIDAAGAEIDGAHPHPALPMASGDLTKEILSLGEYVASPTSGNAFGREVLGAILPMEADRWRLSADAYLGNLAPFFGDVVSIDERLGYYRVHGSNNWTHHEPDPARMRFIVQTDLQKEALVLDAARRRNLPAAADLALNSPWHVYARITLALTDPQNSEETRPIPDLAWKGLRATWRYPRATLRLKSLMTVWLVTTAVVPRGWAARLAVWRVYPARRPAVLRKIAQLVH